METTFGVPKKESVIPIVFRGSDRQELMDKIPDAYKGDLERSAIERFYDQCDALIFEIDRKAEREKLQIESVAERKKFKVENMKMTFMEEDVIRTHNILIAKMKNLKESERTIIIGGFYESDET